MITFTKKILQNEAYKRITTNILSLFSLQGFTYILPLITFPYLTRVLGPEKYGLIAFATAFVAYFQIFVEYGFGLSATRQISINRDNEAQLSKIFSSVIFTKLLLMSLSFLGLSVIVFSIDTFRANWILYFFTFGLVIGNLLMPSFFFLGMEKMKYISILNIGTSLIFTASIFIFIRGSADYIYVPLLNSIGAIIIGIIAMRIVLKDFKIKFNIPSKEDIKTQLKSGWHIFVSNVAISFYTTTNVFVLGIFASSTVVGYYSAAERIIYMAIGLLGPISQSLYPYISSIAVKSKEDAANFIKKIIVFVGSFTFIISVIIFFAAGLVLNILAGNQFDNSIMILRILSFIPFIVGLSNVFGVLFLIALGYANRVSRVQFIVGFCYLFLLVPMTYYLKDIGTALSFLIVEIVITLSFWRIYRNVINELKTSSFENNSSN
ncbi:flippase [Methanobacterium sp. ACI-7]|uniref:flippase n=1 Tax=unclassified Methanobacterium TaxID=2627676 RepID=UPI0039C01C69